MIQMSQYIRNDEEVIIGDSMNQGQGIGDQASHIVPNHPSIGA